MQPTVQEGLFLPLNALMRAIGDKAVFARRKQRHTCCRDKEKEGVVFQDSQELVMKGCEHNTKAPAVREIVNSGINETVKRALEASPEPPTHFTKACLTMGQHTALHTLVCVGVRVS